MDRISLLEQQNNITNFKTQFSNKANLMQTEVVSCVSFTNVHISYCLLFKNWQKEYLYVDKA